MCQSSRTQCSPYRTPGATSRKRRLASAHLSRTLPRTLGRTYRPGFQAGIARNSRPCRHLNRWLDRYHRTQHRLVQTYLLKPNVKKYNVHTNSRMSAINRPRGCRMMGFRREEPHRANTAGHRLRDGNAQTMSSSIGGFWPTKHIQEVKIGRGGVVVSSPSPDAGASSATPKGAPNKTISATPYARTTGA